MNLRVQLSAEQFQEVISSLSSTVIPNPKEKRHEPRVGISGVLKILPLAGADLGICTSVRLRDLSASGVGLLSNEPLEVGSQFIARFAPIRSSRPEMVLVCTVCNCRSLPQKMFGIGATFRKHLRAPVTRANTSDTVWPENPDNVTTRERKRIQEAILS